MENGNECSENDLDTLHNDAFGYLEKNYENFQTTVERWFYSTT